MIAVLEAERGGAATGSTRGVAHAVIFLYERQTRIGMLRMRDNTLRLEIRARHTCFSIRSNESSARVTRDLLDESQLLQIRFGQRLIKLGLPEGLFALGHPANATPKGGSTKGNAAFSLPISKLVEAFSPASCRKSPAHCGSWVGMATILVSAPIQLGHEFGMRRRSASIPDRRRTGIPYLRPSSVVCRRR